jgi:hypothetical protein
VLEVLKNSHSLNLRRATVDEQFTEFLGIGLCITSVTVAKRDQLFDMPRARKHYPKRR